MTETEELRRFAAEKEIDLIGFTTAEPVTCLPWSYDADERHYQPCAPTRVAPNAYAPARVLPEAQSVVMLGMYMYGFDRLRPSVPGCPRGDIGPWTRGYVEAGRYAADAVAAWLEARGHRAVFSNALPYRTLALRCGLGHIGNNGFLYHEGMGSYLRLSCVVTDARLEPYHGPALSGNDCGACRLCVRQCPTGAMAGPLQFDADRCLHLWLQGQGCHGAVIPPEERPKCRNYLMRTGRCLAVCPRNRKLKPRASFPFPAEDKEDSPALIPLVLADEDDFRARVPYHVYKYGIPYIRRNAIIALGNAGDPAAIPALCRGLEVLEPSCRAVCAWALGRLGGETAAACLRRRLACERDRDVLREIRLALDALCGGKSNDKERLFS